MGNEEVEQMPPSFPPTSREAVNEERVNPQPSAEVEEGKEDRKRGRIGSFILEFLTVVALALLISAVVKTFFLQAFEIPSESMENTLVPGDRIVVNKLADSVQDLNRGDVVVFVDPGGWLNNSQADDESAVKKAMIGIGETIGILPQNTGNHLVKRVIGLPGDHVVCCNEEGMLTVNDAPIRENYISPGSAPSDQPFDVTVPQGHLWVMGDNRPRSKDSRFHQAATGFGFVPIQDVEGRAWAIFMPFDRMTRLGNPSSVFSAVPAPAAAK